MAIVLALGSVNVDVQVRSERWPDRGETRLGTDSLLVGGGKAANVAIFARRLGVGAKVLARVGDDVGAEIALEPLGAEGVDVSAVRVAARRATGTALIVVAPDGEKGILLATNANDAFVPADGDAIASEVRAAPAGSVLVVDLEVPAIVVERAVKAAREVGHKVVLDPSFADRVRPELLADVDAITPNPREAEALTRRRVRDVESAFEAGRALLSRGPRTCFMKLGDGGCVAVSERRAVHARAPRVEVVDKTGAGDAFAAAVAIALLEGRTLEETARYGVAAAAHAVGRWGSQAGYGTRGELDAMFARTSAVAARAREHARPSHP